MRAFKHNLTYQLTDELGRSIVTGKYKVGASMPTEAELCEQFGVSRSATREAVKMLSAKGLIESRPKKGIRVLSEDNWNMFDTDVLDWILSSNPSLVLLKHFTEVRAAIEPKAASLAAQNATEDDIKSIEDALERMKLADQGLDDLLESDIAFHKSILLASGNPFIVQLSEFISTALKVAIRYTNKVKDGSADLELHSNILTCIKNKDPKKAAKASQCVLDEALGLINSRL